MYVWKVTLELLYEIQKADSGEVIEDASWTDEVSYVIAAPDGISAIRKARNKARRDMVGSEDKNEEDGTICKCTRVNDVVGLELKEYLDG